VFFVRNEMRIDLERGSHAGLFRDAVPDIGGS